MGSSVASPDGRVAGVKVRKVEVEDHPLDRHLKALVTACQEKVWQSRRR